MTPSRRQTGLLAWLLAATACMLAAMLPTPSTASAGCGKTKRFAATADAGIGAAPLAIGDSVLLGAAVETAALGYDVDVRGCRQIAEGIDVLRRRARGQGLSRLVVVALGSNSAVTIADVRTLLRLLGPSRLLGLVTPREVRGTLVDDAPMLRAATRRWPRRIALVDWAKLAKARPRLTGSDGIHLTFAGRTALTDLLRAPLARVAPRGGPKPPPAAPGTDGGGATAP